MRKLSRSKIVPSLVKDVEHTSAYPGYKYVYFRSFHELDAYFRETCGEDWLDQEWAKFWLRDHWRTAKQDSREFTHAVKDAVKPRNTKLPLHIIKALVKVYQDQGMTLRETSTALEVNDGISLDYTWISRLLKRPTEIES